MLGWMIYACIAFIFTVALAYATQHLSADELPIGLLIAICILWPITIVFALLWIIGYYVSIPVRVIVKFLSHTLEKQD